MPQCQFLFSAVFVFQKSCTGNILGIARDKNPVSYFSVTKTKPEGEQQGASQVARQGPGTANPWPTPGLCLADSGTPSRRLFTYKSPSDLKVTENWPPSTKSSVAPPLPKTSFGGQNSVPAPCRSGELPPEAIAIDFTAIFTAVADSHDEEGVVLPRG